MNNNTLFKLTLTACIMGLSGVATQAADSARESRIVKSVLHGLTLLVKLPADMPKIQVIEEANLAANGGADRDVLKDIVFVNFRPNPTSQMIMRRLSGFSAGQSLTASELEQHACLQLEREAAELGSMKKFNGTFLGKPAFAVLAEYMSAPPKTPSKIFSVITREPVGGRFYKLSYFFRQGDAGYDLSPQELITGVTLAESGGSSSASEKGPPLGEFSGSVQASYPGRKAVSISRKVTFRLDGLPLMKSKDTSDGVNFATSYVLLHGSWSGTVFKSTHQQVLFTELPNNGWVNEDIVITALSGDRLKMESSWPLGGKSVELSGTLNRE